MFDLLIRNGLVIDGSARPAFRADVAVEGDRIAQVGSLRARAARRAIDAAGLVVAPGFIDMHSHADLTLPAYPEAANSIRQGVTTEVVGMCGFSAAPVAEGRLRELQQFVGGFGPNLAWEWSTFGQYLAALERARPAVNVVPFVGHGALRIAAMGFASQPASPQELESQRNLLAASMEQGAWGMSTGLVYPPGCYADSGEITELARAVAERGGLYFTHIRGELDTLFAALEEALATAEAAGVPLQIAHLKAAGRQNWGKMPQVLAAIHAARERGLAVHVDFYPYTAGSTHLSNLLPPWVQSGGKEAMLARLAEPASRARLRAEMEEGLPGWSNQLRGAGGWEQVMINGVQSPPHQRWQGLRIAEAARQAGKDPFDFAFDLLLEDEGSTTMIVFMMSEDDVVQVMRSPYSVVGSDSLGVTGPQARAHPRAFGCFARLLGHYVRERGILTLEQAIHKMAGLSAQILGLRDRGLVRPGMAADLVVFDAEGVSDRATYEQPARAPDGVAYVLVNGHVAVDQGEQTAVRAGRVLRRAG